MVATVVPRANATLEVLNLYNYEDWSLRVETYLIAEGLWDVLDAKHPYNNGGTEDMNWWMKNAKALHAIQISCRSDVFGLFIGDIRMAKDAWEILAKRLKAKNRGVNSEVDSDDNPNSNDGIAEEEIGGLEEFELFEMVRGQRWEALREYIERHPVAGRTFLRGRTPLQEAVSRQMVDGVKVLLPSMKKRDLDIPSSARNTALSMAIENWRSETDDAIEIVKCIVEKNKKLLLRAVCPSTNAIPLVYALSLDKPKMADYLYSETPLEMLKSVDKAEIISTCLRMKHLDIPLKLLRRFPDSIFAKNHSGECPLIELAGTRAGLFPNVSQLRIWKQLIYRLKCFFGRLFANLRNLSGIGGIYQMKFLHVRTIEILDAIVPRILHARLNHMQRKIVEKALFQAVERGHAPFIKEILDWNLGMAATTGESWFSASTNEHDYTLFQFAAEQRQDKIFDLISSYCGKKGVKEIIGRKHKFGNNMLHVVGKWSPLTKIDHIRGAALQMQYELQWFQKVERMADPKDLNCINSDGRTPREEFTWNHKTLAKAGEKSMKETATSSSAVSALIVTIMFAAALTVPGGINGNTGIPIDLHTKGFKIFIVADVISLCSSTTSVILYLGILLSRFAEQDFLTSLPTKLIIGFLTIFLSIGAMMIAFSSAIFIMLPGNPSIAISSCVLASLPIASLWMQFPYLLEIIISTYGSRLHLIYQFLSSVLREFTGGFPGGIEGF